MTALTIDLFLKLYSQEQLYWLTRFGLGIKNKHFVPVGNNFYSLIASETPEESAIKRINDKIAKLNGTYFVRHKENNLFLFSSSPIMDLKKLKNDINKIYNNTKSLTFDYIYILFDDTLVFYHKKVLKTYKINNETLSKIKLESKKHSNDKTQGE